MRGALAVVSKTVKTTFVILLHYGVQKGLCNTRIHHMYCSTLKHILCSKLAKANIALDCDFEPIMPSMLDFPQDVHLLLIIMCLKQTRCSLRVVCTNFQNAGQSYVSRAIAKKREEGQRFADIFVRLSFWQPWVGHKTFTANGCLHHAHFHRCMAELMQWHGRRDSRPSHGVEDVMMCSSANILYKTYDAATSTWGPQRV